MASKGYPELKQFKPSNPHKYVGDVNNIVMRSSWETKFARYCDINPSVIQWNSEGVEVPYWSSADNKMRTYHVDFIMKLRNADGEIETLLVEIKPHKQTLPPEKKRGKKEVTYLNECHTYQVNMDKWLHAKKYAEERNMKFIILTEEHLYGKKV